MSNYPFRASKQIEDYIGQFLRVFTGFKVSDGVARNGDYNVKPVRVVYGNMSRVLSSVINKRDWLSNPTLPMIAGSLQGITIDQNNRKTQHHKGEITTGAPGSYAALARLSGPALLLSFDVGIYASSTSELFGLLEQILLVFNPRVAIQSSSNIQDSTYITDIEFEGIQSDINYPMGMDARLVMMTLQFSVPARLNYPQGENDNIIEQIIAKVKDGNNDDILFVDTITGDPETGEITTEVESPGVDV